MSRLSLPFVRSLLSLVLLVGLSVGGIPSEFAASRATAQVVGTIFGPGGRTFPVALSPLKNLSGNEVGAVAATQFAEIIGRDLTLSGLFRVISRDAYIESPGTSGLTAESINFDNWSVIGAVFLVKGSVLIEGDGLTLEARLFDVNQRRQLDGRRYRGQTADLRRMAHRFADEIMRELTGERGPFDSRLAFLSTRSGRFKDAYVMSLDGGDLKRVTTENTINLAPAWSTDWGSILLTSYRTGRPQLYSIDIASGLWSRVSRWNGLTVGGRWAPDGRRIAVAREEGGISDIYILNADGSVQHRLTDHSAIDVSPAWSPDGSQITFCSNRSGAPQIYVVDVDGGRLRRVTSQGSYNTSPSWSPKGDQLAYVSRIGSRFQVFTVQIDGAGSRQVTQSAGDNEDPSWSPDGRYLVFSSTRSGRAQLYVSDRLGGSQVQLTEGNGNDTSPTWSGWLD